MGKMNKTVGLMVLAASLLAFMSGCGLWDRAKHTNPYDPLTPNQAPNSILLNYKYIDDVTQNSIKFHWLPSPDTDFHYYMVYRVVANPTFTPSDANSITSMSNQNDTTFIDTNLSPHTLYCYKIRIYDKGGKYNESPVLRCFTAPQFVTAVVVWTSGTYTGDQYLTDVKYDQDATTHKLFVTGRGRDATSDGYFIRMVDAYSVVDGSLSGIFDTDNVLKSSNGAPALLSAYAIAPLQTNAADPIHLAICDFISGWVDICDKTINSGIPSSKSKCNYSESIQLDIAKG